MGYRLDVRISINYHWIKGDAMTFVIAELGVNWRNLNEADELIKQCSAAGATACKFQAHSDDIIYSLPKNLQDQLLPIQLHEDSIRYLYWRCCNAGVEFMATPMYPDAVKMLDPYVKRWKIREKDSLNHKLINYCVCTGKEVLISRQDVVLNYLSGIKQLYCCPEYPPKDYPTVKDFEGMQGYSCHIPVVDHITYAVNRFNLEYLEVHVKKNRYPDGYCTVDNNVSITVDELKRVVDGIN